MNGKTLLLLAILLPGCDRVSAVPRRTNGLPPESSVSSPLFIRTDRQEYWFGVTNDAIRLTIVASFTNSTNDTLTLHPCRQHPLYPLAVNLERLEGDQWQIALATICTRALMRNPPTLPPGAVRVDTLRFWGSRLPNTFPAFRPGPLSGSYRLHYSDIYRKWYPHDPPPNANNRMGEELPDSLRLSNVFSVIE
jgi:hypothetical protein